MRIRLIQTGGGKPLSADPGNENEVIVDMNLNYAHHTEHRHHVLAGAGIHQWGSYVLRDTNGYRLSSRIGRKDPKSDSNFKLWGYNAGELTIRFLTISTGHVTGGGDKAPDEVEMELDLYNVVLLGNKVSPNGNATRHGRVLLTYDAAPLFRVGQIFWEPR